MRETLYAGTIIAEDGGVDSHSERHREHYCNGQQWTFLEGAQSISHVLSETPCPAAALRYNRNGMADIVLRPTTKFILAGFVFVCLIILAALITYATLMRPADQPPWLPVVALVLLVFPLRSWLAQRTFKATISGDRLRFETGIFAKSTRIIQLAKIQDVRVNQTLWQRMFNVGDVAIETAGEASRLVLPHFDRPHTIAEEILAASTSHPGV